jgi:hypothetical protein
MVLLLGSAIYLSLGLQDSANGLAVYSFYLLVAGVALQIASYVKYGEEKSPASSYFEPVVKPRSEKLKLPTRVVAIILATVVIIGTVAVVEYYPALTSGVPCLPCKPPSASVSFANSLKEPDGSVIETLGVSVIGGALPYNFTARWSDAFVQTNKLGLFTRTFLSGQTISVSAQVTVTSKDSQRANLNVTISAP